MDNSSSKTRNKCTDKSPAANCYSDQSQQDPCHIAVGANFGRKKREKERKETETGRGVGWRAVKLVPDKAERKQSTYRYTQGPNKIPLQAEKYTRYQVCACSRARQTPEQRHLSATLIDLRQSWWHFRHQWLIYDSTHRRSRRLGGIRRYWLGFEYFSRPSTILAEVRECWLVFDDAGCVSTLLAVFRRRVINYCHCQLCVQ